MSDDKLNAYLDMNQQVEELQDLVAALESRADMLARCVLYGLAEPYSSTGSTLLLVISQNLIEGLASDDCPQKGPERVARWASDQRIPVEIAAIMHAALAETRPPGFDDLEERLRPILT